jgi:hypothetical protein
MEQDIDKALRQLKNQGISVSDGIVGPQGIVRDVMGFMLTVPQILQLRSEQKLNAEGIREFAKEFKEKNAPK